MPNGNESGSTDEETKQHDCEKIIDSAAPETTGKFGTGFLTTHMLSRVVQISGIYENAFIANKFHKFTLKLDRSPEDKDAMI